MGKPFRILTCQGIGDSVWTLFKAQDIARKHGCDSVEILVGGWERSDQECRAIPFLRQFDFVSDARFYQTPRISQGPMLLPGPPTDERGRYRYLPDGKPPHWAADDVDFVCCPNAALENGTRLEDWLPEYEIDWTVVANHMPDFRRLAAWPKDVVFFLGSMSANAENSRAGHNRGALWTAAQWAELGDRVVDAGSRVVIVGAGYDSAYYQNEVEPLIRRRNGWENRIAEYSIMETLGVCDRASAVVAYQSGIGILSHYLMTPTAMWWRPEGNSIIDGANVTFSEDMAHAWADPAWQENARYNPCIYGREGVEDIFEWLTRWL